jgi:hypothetical protein
MLRSLRPLKAVGSGFCLLLAAISMTVPANAAGRLAQPAARPVKMNLKPAPQRDSYQGPPMLFGKDRPAKIGGYAGIGGAYTRFLGRDSGLVSLEGALLLDHRLSLGLAGYGFTRTPRGPDSARGEARELGAGYGGLALRYSVFGNLPVYGTFGVVLGAGAVNLHRDYGWDDEEDWDSGWNHDDEAWERGAFDPFLVVQPEVALQANLTRWLRLGTTFGYRFTGGVGRFGLESSDLNGIVAGGHIQLGWL